MSPRNLLGLSNESENLPMQQFKPVVVFKAIKWISFYINMFFRQLQYSRTFEKFRSFCSFLQIYTSVLKRELIERAI